jgi:hypothetical protein
MARAFLACRSGDDGRPAVTIDLPGLNDLSAPVWQAYYAFRTSSFRVATWCVDGGRTSFLAYDFRTCYPHWQLAVCSALTASSRAQHFMALEQLSRLLGVTVFPRSRVHHFWAARG